MVVKSALLAGLFAFVAWGQTSEKVIYLTHLESPQAIQELTNVVRSIGDIRDVSADAAKRSLTVKGTSDQIAVAGWVTAGLDIPAGAPAPRDLPVDDPRASLAQIYYLSHVDNPRDLQEIVNAVRSIVDIQRFFPTNQQRAIVMRGSPAQVKAADWLLGLIDQPAGAQGAVAASVNRLSAGDWDSRGGLVVQVASAKHFQTPEAIQDIVNVTRSLADLQRCFPLSSRRLILMRGNDDQIALANWLMGELDSPRGGGTQEFKVAGPGNQVAQVAYLNAASPQTLRETVNQIRSETRMPRVFLFPPNGAVAMRGTPDQLALAQQVIRSR